MTTISQPFCQKSLFGGVDTDTYCGNHNNNVPILSSCGTDSDSSANNSACGVDGIYSEQNQPKVVSPGLCALHDKSVLYGYNTIDINPGCATNQWQFCQYDWQKHSAASAWVCTLPDPGQCPIFSTVNPTIASFVSSEVSGGDPRGCTTEFDTPPCGEIGDSAPLTCVYNISDFTPTAIDAWVAYDWGQCPNVDADSAVDNINGIMSTLCNQSASSKNLTQFCPTGETDCMLSDLVGDTQGWGTYCESGPATVPSPDDDDDSSRSLLLILLVGGLLLLIIGGIPIAAIIFFLILKK